MQLWHFAQGILAQKPRYPANLLTLKGVFKRSPWRRMQNRRSSCLAPNYKHPCKWDNSVFEPKSAGLCVVIAKALPTSSKMPVEACEEAQATSSLHGKNRTAHTLPSQRAQHPARMSLRHAVLSSGTAVVILDQIHPTPLADPSPCGTALGSCNPGRSLS